MRGTVPAISGIVFLLAACAPAENEADEPAILPDGWTLLLAEDFDGEAPVLSFSDPEAFDPGDGRTGRGLRLAGPADYRPPVRSPLAIALLDGVAFTDFLLEADLLQTGREYGHRDLCLFFGFQAPDRYYYVHLASRADEHAHNMFVVDRAARAAFADHTTPGVDWGRGTWHRVRILRRSDSGEITVWFDDMEEPVMRGRHHAFKRGRIGFGSFDDTGILDNLRIWGPKAHSVEPVRFR